MNTKRFLSLILSVVMALSLVTVSAFADSETDEIIKNGIASSEAYISDELEKLHETAKVGVGSEWFIIAMLRAGKNVDDAILNEYYDALCTHVVSCTSDSKPTDLERISLSLSAMGKDITNVDGVNLAELIYNSPRLSDGSNELAYALIALDASGIVIPSDALWSRDKIKEEILKYVTSDGGFGLSDNLSTNLDMTAICIQAFTPYLADGRINTAVDGALSYLKNSLNSDFTCADNPNSTAQILMALSALRIDVTDVSNGFSNDSNSIISSLYSYRNPDGNGFLYENIVNSLTTIQIMQAFDAYRKAQKEDVSYWDFINPGQSYDDKVTSDSSHITSDAAEPETVFVTIVSESEVVKDKNGRYVAQAPVSVRDINFDGRLDVNEALYAAHETYYSGGAENGYSTFSGVYGLSLAILWGKGTENLTASAGYWLNNGSCWSLNDEVKTNDSLTAFNYYDTITWRDAYSYFTRNSATVNAGSSVSLNLKYASRYDVFSPCPGAKVKFTSVNGAYEQIFASNSDGNVVIAVPSNLAEGSYYAIAYKEDGSIVPAVCKINVNPVKKQPSASGGGGSLSFTVSFITNGAGDVKKQNVKKNSALIRPQDPVKEDCIFDGWYTDPELKSPYDFTSKVTENFTLYAKWSEKTDVKSDAQEKSLSFTDIEKGIWYEEAVAYVAYKKLFAGVSEKEFAPDENMTRAMLITVLHRLASPEAEIYENKFTDVSKDSWYYDAVCWGSSLGITSGINENEFAPDEILTREQLATILHRYARIMNYDLSTSGNLKEYSDYDKISTWAIDALSWAKGADIVNGTDNSLLSPDSSATRAQVAAILMRFCKSIVK